MTIQLGANTFTPLPLHSIEPKGWLARQLRIQADGLSGHLDEFWPDIRDSRWFGGQAEGWERAPYWLDGFIPLAYQLKDAAMIAKVERHMGYILSNQQEDGWLGPVEIDPVSGKPGVPAGYDLWAELLILKVLVVYADASGDTRALEAMERALANLDRLIDTRPLFNWGQFRWYEGLIAIYYVHERKPAKWLLDLAVKIHAQGFDWGNFFKRWPCTEATPRGRWNYMSHVVNNGEAVKAHGLWWRITRDDADRAAVYDMVEKLERYHGMVTGMFSGDECLAGKSPTVGTELCAVNEYAYSLELMLAAFGEASLGDRLEKVVYNALPATFSPDMWTHQYDQQVNQVECSTRENRTFGTNGPDANLFGLEPYFGCCTANLSQGWPKFAAHLWMRSADGLAAVAYAPSSVSAQINGAEVQVELETDYPFRDTLSFRVFTSRKSRFSLHLRIPAWAEGAHIEIKAERMEAASGQFFRLERVWEGVTEFTMTLPMSAELIRGSHGAVAIGRGPLVYALKMGEDWRCVNQDKPHRELPHADYEVYAATPWNYALLVHEKQLDHYVHFEERPVGAQPFSPDGAGMSAKVQGRRLTGWGMDGAGSAADTPVSPVRSDEPLEELTLIPYGCTNLRVTEFPRLEV